ncbi:MAG: stage 0 sporulation protein [Anaerolineales bacterium]|nr:stage 0 sporulation protein [Anaerolineales bacterium]
MQANIIGVRFLPIGKVYHFYSDAVPDIKVSDYVIVETSRGHHLGEVVQLLEENPGSYDGDLKKVERRATTADLLLQQTWRSRQTEAMINCRELASRLGLLNQIKIIAAEFNFDGSRLTIMYSSESEEKVDLKSLRRDLNKQYSKSQVDLRQIGPRDVAKIIGGMGACGIETRCCSRFLTDFSPISIKMAKEQGISLTPSEITGMCGRLRCCLIYEFELYVEARKKLPKRKKRVITPKGEGLVVDLYPLRDSVLVRLDSDDNNASFQEFKREELEPWEELNALRKKNELPCEKHGNGECDCNKNKKNSSANKQ